VEVNHNCISGCVLNSSDSGKGSMASCVRVS